MSLRRVSVPLTSALSAIQRPACIQYLFQTRPSAQAPGGCVRRPSCFCHVLPSIHTLPLPSGPWLSYLQNGEPCWVLGAVKAVAQGFGTGGGGMLCRVCACFPGGGDSPVSLERQERWAASRPACPMELSVTLPISFSCTSLLLLPNWV